LATAFSFRSLSSLGDVLLSLVRTLPLLALS
jgi:hypothetical protein